MRYMETAVHSRYLLPWKAFLANAVTCCEYGHITGQTGQCVRKVGARNGLPPPQQIAWTVACS